MVYTSCFITFSQNGHFDFPIFAKIEKVLLSGSSMAVLSIHLICALVSQLHVTQALGVAGETAAAGPKTY